MEDLQFSAFKTLIQTPSPPELGPGPRAGIRAEAELNAELDRFFSQKAIPRQQEDALRSAALLWHDHLDASHHLSQQILDSNGSFLHAIMHRREPDYSNAKYWFRRVGQHQAHGAIASQVATLQNPQAPDLLARLLPKGQWDPFAFVDLCEAACARQPEPQRVDLLRQIQAIEFWHLLASL